MNEIAYTLQIWLPLLVWQQVDAPRYFKGYITVATMSVLLIIMCFIVRRLHNRELSAMAMAAQGQHATESCVQLYPHRALSMDDGDNQNDSRVIQLSQFKSEDSDKHGIITSDVVSLSSADAKYAPSPTTTVGSSTIVASPSEKKPPSLPSSSKNSTIESPKLDSGETEIETCASKIV